MSCDIAYARQCLGTARVALHGRRFDVVETNTNSLQPPSSSSNVHFYFLDCPSLWSSKDVCSLIKDDRPDNGLDACHVVIDDRTNTMKRLKISHTEVFNICFM